MRETPQFFRLTEKPWESSILSTKVYSLTISQDAIAVIDSSQTAELITILEEQINRLPANKPYMIVARLNASHLGSVQLLEDAGFHLIECYLEYDHDLSSIPAPAKSGQISPFSHDDIPALEQLAHSSFLYSRFHVDEQIPNNLANRTRSEWIKNACLGRAESVLVSRDNERITGFVICQRKVISSVEVGVLDLMAVDHDYRRKGLGYDLSVAFLNYCREHRFSKAIVGTQAHNVPSNRLYQKVGFRLHQTYYSLHKHIR